MTAFLGGTPGLREAQIAIFVALGDAAQRVLIVRPWNRDAIHWYASAKLFRHRKPPMGAIFGGTLGLREAEITIFGGIGGCCSANSHNLTMKSQCNPLQQW